MGGVDVEANDVSRRRTEADDAPIMAVVVSTSLPPIKDCTRGLESALVRDGRLYNERTREKGLGVFQRCDCVSRCVPLLLKGWMLQRRTRQTSEPLVLQGQRWKFLRGARQRDKPAG